MKPQGDLIVGAAAEELTGEEEIDREELTEVKPGIWERKSDQA